MNEPIIAIRQRRVEGCISRGGREEIKVVIKIDLELLESHSDHRDDRL